MEQVILLNADYSFLDVISWKKAMKLICKEKAEVIKEQSKRIMRGLYAPLVIKLVKFIRIVYQRSIPFSKRNVFVRDDFTCQYCGEVYSRNTKSLTIDHIIPKSREGKNTWDNCVASCKQCNTMKGKRTPREMGWSIPKRPVKPTINEFMQKKLKSLGIKKVLEDLYSEMTV